MAAYALIYIASTNNRPLMSKPPFDYLQLKYWFIEKKRDLPWRQTCDPYAIWISEIMLQQTQVAVVIPYFLNWMRRFPNVRLLAEASLDEVIKSWEGLGYYSRARHLHEAAKYLVEHFEGEIPSEEEQLKKIKGLGPYTIGAILSFAFHQKKAAVDGNVIRVLTRYFGLMDDIAKPSTVNKLRQLAQLLLPNEESWIINEALIELGATVCQRKACCHVCPLQTSCISFKKGMVDQLPIKSKKKISEYLYRAVAVIQCGTSFLVQRGQKGAIMSDLYEFPYFDIPKEGISSRELQEKIEQHFALQILYKQVLKEVKQGFTRYHVRLYPILFTCAHLKSIEGFEWLTQKSLMQLAFSSGHRRIFQQLEAVDLLLQV
jgi:A/G-specific adenine glycosylase